MASGIIELIIIALAVGGLILSIYIYRTKRNGKQLVCPMDGSCDMVVHSEYSIIFGVSVDILGIFYYGVIALMHIFILLFTPFPIYTPLVIIALAISFVGFLMSIYFTWLQAFKLKEWCTLCVVSALITTAIFVFSFLE